MREIYHSSFARYSVYRERAYSIPYMKCAYCGETKTTKKGTVFLFKYSTISDGMGARKQYLNGLFCGIDCMRSYHNINKFDE